VVLLRALMRVLRFFGIASTPERGARTMIHLACSDARRSVWSLWVYPIEFSPAEHLRPSHEQ
jgi:hypothetical protein